MEKILKMLKDGLLTDTLDNIGKVATIFNPTVGSGIILASKITDSMASVKDEFLEDEVIGLNGSALILDKMIKDKNIDFDKLEMISENLKSMSQYIEKSAKLVK